MWGVLVLYWGGWVKKKEINKESKKEMKVNLISCLSNKEDYSLSYYTFVSAIVYLSGFVY